VAELREYFGAKHVFLVSSGTAALTVILLALRRLSDRREVLLPAYTCFSVPAAVEKAGLTVTLADVDPETFDFDYGSLGKSIGPDTLGVVSTHLFGIPCDIERVQRLCVQTGTFLIEDAAQAMGGRYKGKMVGSLGDVGFFSLGRGKNITAGSGGIVLTNCERIAAALAAEYDRLETPRKTTALAEFARIVLMSIFIHPTLYWLPAALPFLGLGETRFERQFPIRRMNGMSAGALRHWQDRLILANRIRAVAAAHFGARLGFKRLEGAAIPYLRVPVLMGSREARDRACALSVRRGLGIGRMYPAPINEIEEIKEHFAGQTFPSATLIADRLLTLPTHHLVAESDRRSICDLLEDRAVRGTVREVSNTLEIGGAAGKRWS
jgi:perosamine synthetase